MASNEASIFSLSFAVVKQNLQSRLYIYLGTYVATHFSTLKCAGEPSRG